MGFGIGNIATCVLNGTDISEYCKSASFNSRREEKKLPRLGGHQTAKLPGPVEPGFRLEGWTDAVVVGIIAPLALAADPAAVPIAVTMMTGVAFTANVKLSNFDISADSEEPQSWTVDCMPDDDGVDFN